MLRAKSHAMALYGCETTQPRIMDMRALGAATADALVGGHQTQRNPSVVAALFGDGTLELHTGILMRRWKLLRRAWHIRPQWQAEVFGIMQALINMGGNISKQG